jgi:hypothetical protein
MAESTATPHHDDKKVTYKQADKRDCHGVADQ